MSTTTVLRRCFSGSIPTDGLPRNSEAHYYAKRHVKIMLLVQTADYHCNSEASDQPAHPLSVSQASFLYYVRDKYRHSAPLSFVCAKVHIMRPQTQAIHSQRMFKKKFLNFEDSGPVHMDKFLDHEESTKRLWSHRSYGSTCWSAVGLYMYQEK